jgi:hypothetical protein
VNADGQISEYIEIFQQNFQKDSIRLKSASWLDNIYDRFKVNNPNELWQKLLLQSRCSAIVKLIKSEKSMEVFVSHATFDNYIAMVRIFKNYDFEYSGSSGPLLPSLLTFSSYAGTLTSTDDYYLVNGKTVVQETTIAVLDAS